MDIAKWVRAQWDRVLAWVCVAAGAIVLVVGWAGVSRYPYPADQLPYIISGGVGGLFLLGLGAMLWLSADLRDEWRKLDEIDRRNARFYEGQEVAARVSGREAPAMPAALPETPASVDDTRENAVVPVDAAAGRGTSRRAQTKPAAPAAAARRRPSASGTDPAVAPAPVGRASTRRSPRPGAVES